MNLKSAIYRALGENDKSKEIANQVLELDKLNMLARVELSIHQDNKAEICEMFDSKSENFIDVAAAYVNAGFYQDAISALEISQKEYPLYDYYKAYDDNGRAYESRYYSRAFRSFCYCCTGS